MLRYTDDATQIRSRIPAYLRDAHATPSAPEAPQRTTGTAFRVPNAHKTKQAIKTSAWDGIIVDQPTTVSGFVEVDDDCMELFTGL